METRRERIIQVLREAREPLEAEEIARILGLKPGEARLVYEDLGHVAKTLRRLGLTLYMQPPFCRDCGYVFKSVDRPHRPSKCPRCKGQRIAPPRFIIAGEGKD